METSLPRSVRFEMRKLSPELVAKDLKVASKIVYPARQKPQYFMYGDKELTKCTMHIRHAHRVEFLDLLPFDALRGIVTDENSERVYRPNYAEIDRTIIYLLTHESKRMFKNDSLRTDDGDGKFAPRTRKTNLAVAEVDEDDGDAVSTLASQR